MENEKYYSIDSDGHSVLVGKYNLDIRNAYLRYKVQAYLIDHPGAFSEQAFRAARQAWKRKALTSITPLGARTTYLGSAS